MSGRREGLVTVDAVTWGLVAAVFVACVVEMVEATTIVLAMGFTRGWRSAILGTVCALVALAAFTAIAGYALANWLPEAALQLVIGTLLLIFGLQWLRKAIYRVSGRKALHDEDAIYAEEVAAARDAGEAKPGIDMFGFMVSFKGVFLEGMEVVFIVLTFGLSANNVPAAIYGAAAAVVLVLIAAVLVRKPLSMVPENTLKFGVGLLLTAFGTFWSIEGLGIFRAGHHSLEFPGADLAILYFLAATIALTWILIRVLRRPAARSGSSPAGARNRPRDRGGRAMIKFFKAFGRFWYEFIIGDDWKIAVSVVVALAITLGLYLAGLAEQAVTMIGGVLVLAAFTVSLAIDVRASAKKR